jgi:class 3 adenylate cyclase
MFSLKKLLPIKRSKKYIPQMPSIPSMGENGRESGSTRESMDVPPKRKSEDKACQVNTILPIGSLDDGSLGMRHGMRPSNSGNGIMAPKRKSYSQTNAMGKYQILVVDNDHISKVMMESVLSLDRFVIKHALITDFDKVVDELVSSDVLPDVMLLDTDLIDMPKHMIRKLREHFDKYTLPVLIATSSRYQNHVYDSMDDDINDFVTKPFRIKEVVHRLGIILQTKRFIKKEHILSDILPANVVYSLEMGESFVCEYHPYVTILFSDIVQYTSISGSWQPRKIIEMLNKMFCGFDEICLSLSVYKVETIGDAYMIAAGHDGNSKHVDVMIKVGLCMLRFVNHDMQDYGVPIQIRIGIHTGEAFSGVIGKIRPRFCFFGDTVNVASRMESHGEPGVIQVSRAVYDNVSEDLKRRLDITACGMKAIKGKGDMETFLVSLKEEDVLESDMLYERYNSNSSKIQKYEGDFDLTLTSPSCRRLSAEHTRIINSFL